MPTSTPPAPIERAQPLLGTLVKIGLSGLGNTDAQTAITAGFEAISEVHDLMSFHHIESDVSRLNREAFGASVKVNRHTYIVIRQSLEIAAASQGFFDISVAPQLVTWGVLPRPEGAPDPDPEASWRDIELIAPDCVRFHRPLWIDLGGIAKGYAVDLALERMALDPTIQCRINAGGDLCVAGPNAERILLRVPGHTAAEVPMVELSAASLASSSGQEFPKRYGQRIVGPHVNGRDRCAVGTRSFASVVADRCMIADALTKVVLAAGPRASKILSAFNATGYLHTARLGWRTLGIET